MPFTSDKNEDFGAILVNSKVFNDERGYIFELYKKSAFKEFGIDENFVQENVSFSKKNVIRGLHYQKDPDAQGKLVICLRGKVLDVAVDVRKGSPHYGKWKSTILEEGSGNLFYLPPGFAHGVLTLTDDVVIMYNCTKEYAPDSERGIIWNDPDLAIDWGTTSPIVVPRDASFPLFKDADNNFKY